MRIRFHSVGGYGTIATGKLLTDILAAFAENPLEPAYGELDAATCHSPEPLSWLSGRTGIVEIGADEDGFAFDCERPRHPREHRHPRASPARALNPLNGEDFRMTSVLIIDDHPLFREALHRDRKSVV